jgi:hypothetical protein
VGDFVENLLELLGELFELAGSLYLVNRYMVRRPRIRTLRFLLLALFSLKRAELMARIGQNTPEKHAKTIRGIALICLGFFLKTLPHLYNVTETSIRYVLSHSFS